MNKKRTILLTGGAGFIGSHTADALGDRGYKVRILDSLNEDHHGGRWPSYVQKKGFELLRGDVRKKADWVKALKGVDAVYHFAAHQGHKLDFGNFFETNTVGTALLYETIVEKKYPVKKVILASSQSVYGDGFYECAKCPGGKIFHADLRSWEALLKGDWEIRCPHGKSAEQIPFREDQKVAPTNSYALSKYAAEGIAMRIGRTYEIPSVALRYSVVQGPRQSLQNLFSDPMRIFVYQALTGQPLTVYEDGGQTRDFVNVHDVVEANLIALGEPKANFEIFNVGGGRGYPVLELAKEVKRATGSASEIETGSFRRTNVRHAVSDMSKLKRLGWRPRHSILDSIEEYTAWFRAEGLGGSGKKKRK